MADAPVLHRGDDGRLLFWCPGCDGAHGVPVGEGEGPRWAFNGDLVVPTFKPSIDISWGLCGRRCHSFVTDGQIQFQPDCTHALAGQTAALQPWAD